MKKKKRNFIEPSVTFKTEQQGYNRQVAAADEPSTYGKN